MKKTFVKQFSFLSILFMVTSMSVSAQMYSASYYYNNGNATVCTMDAYVCPNGTTVGRTGPNCQLVCPSVVSYTPSYNYTSGCYTYYYNGQTRTTSVVSYNCQSQTQTYYPVATTYTYPSYTHPTQNTYYYGNSGYHTYNYCNGSWRSAYYGNTNCTNSWLSNGNMYYYTSPTHNTYQNGCYYQNGYLVCH